MRTVARIAIALAATAIAVVTWQAAASAASMVEYALIVGH